MEKVAMEMKKVVTFGEGLKARSSSGNTKLFKATLMNFFFGGSEVNMAVSFANKELKDQHMINAYMDFMKAAPLATFSTSGIWISAVKKLNHSWSV